MFDDRVPWPHAPPHQLSTSGTYFVTAGTYLRQHHFCGAHRLRVLHRGLLTVCREFNWTLEAWAVFSNHYHFVAHSPCEEDSAQSLPTMLGKLHGRLATWINQQDHRNGRLVWHNFWETRLTFQRSFLARLNYTNQNAVHHGLVPVANQYPWCSASWFERTATPAMIRTLGTFKRELVKVYDEYSPSSEW